MPVHYPSSSSSSSSKSRKSMGFSIDDLIKTDQTLPTARPLSSTPHLIPIPWIPPPSPNHLYHLHRQSLLEYFRCAHPYPRKSLERASISMSTVFRLLRFRSGDDSAPSQFISETKTKSNCIYACSTVKTGRCLREEPLHRW